MLTDTAMRYIRSKIGAGVPPVDDATLNLEYDEVGLASQVALNHLEQQLADIMAAGPASYNVSGRYSEDYTSVINGLQTTIKRVQSEVAAERKTIAAGIDPWAPVTADTALAGAAVTVGQAQRVESSWDR